MKIYDISVSITPAMPTWPGDPPVRLQTLSNIKNGADCNVSQIEMSVHTGTHIDSAKHFFNDGQTVDQVPLGKLMGETLVMEIEESDRVITKRVLEAHPDRALLAQAKKVLFKTSNSALWRSHPTEFQTDYVGIDTSAAHHLAHLSLDLIGVDYLSVSPIHETSEPHRIILSRGTIILEGVDLTGIKPGFYQLFCLPLNILGAEGAPGRAILMDVDEHKWK